jgi:SAM-dependent methyltransferase
VIFLNAFLLFQVEPLLGKIILPWFGGAAAVWSVCLLFFQAALLLGYLYAHLLSRRLAPRAQAYVHIALLALSLAWLPIAPSLSWKPASSGDPTLRILLLLAASVGLPFLLLSATSPLLQAWRARTGTASPYRLYALSNAGSMLALLSYPVLIEPRLSTVHQSTLWSVFYALAALLCALVTWQAASLPAARGASTAEPAEPVPAAARLLWLALPACASVLLIGVSAHVTQNIAAAPMLWIVPLALYLFSFILCFDAPRWYARSLYLRLLAVALAGMAYALSPAMGALPLPLLATLYCGGLFLCCMFCHGELVRLKPHPSHLTSFYLTIATGSALGALFAGLLAPRLFPANFELPIALGACALLVVAVHARDPRSPFYRPAMSAQWRTPAWLAVVALALGLCAGLVSIAFDILHEPRAIARNFYGVLSVTDELHTPHSTTPPGYIRKLRNGSIDHGLQWLDPARRRQPTAYYGPQTGVGLALVAAAAERPALRVGVVGLGAGTLAAYGRAGDRYTFFEIDPLVERFARKQFTFLGDSAAQTRVELGDGRLLLERYPARSCDVLVIDAFSGDSIPIHLLTVEAFRLYFRALAPGGVLAVHISNRYLDLEPVVAAATARLGRRATVIDNAPDPDAAVFHSTWVLIGNGEPYLGQDAIERAGVRLSAPSPARMWRDDFSSLFPLLR